MHWWKRYWRATDVKNEDKLRQAKDAKEMAMLICDAPLCLMCDGIKKLGACPGDCYDATVKWLESEAES